MELIRTHQLSKNYQGKAAVKALDLNITQGSFVAYLGTNGAGKSTTIKMLVGLLKPSSGQIKKNPDLKIGVVFQDSILDGELTVIENLKNRAALYKNLDHSWFDKVIALTQLEDILHQKYSSLSGGQRRRVDIARSLIHQPDLLFLDEPTTGLDVQTRKLIWNLIHQLRLEQGLTIFLTTHYLEEAETADQIYIIDKGSILAQGSAQEIIEGYSQNQLLFKVTNPEAFLLKEPRASETEEGLLIEGLAAQETIVFLSQYQEEITQFEYKKGGLSHAFLAITGREISS
ncbi:ABC transporter ATP-binding protein [Streptococcus ferus]|uniref:ABC transporter ATP-binding protein n=1 Tax=Streptococcus ferus TaxID=1345 RepID=UPI003510EA06